MVEVMVEGAAWHDGKGLVGSQRILHNVAGGLVRMKAHNYATIGENSLDSNLIVFTFD